MGLDVYAFRKITFLRDLDDKDPGKGETFIFIHPEWFRVQAGDLKKGVYSYRGRPYHFRAGSYTGYNEWRCQLARMLGKTPEEIWANPVPGPFVELINFSDCDGVFCAGISRKLFLDFKEYLPQAEKKGLKDPDFLIHYKQFMKAFRIGADGGCVEYG